jgi:hypothetical protein
LGVKNAHRRSAYISAEHANTAAGTETGTESSETEIPARLNIICPLLSGDDPIVQYVWSQGYFVTAIDLVPQAVEAMRNQFGAADDKEDSAASDNSNDNWKCEENGATAIWRLSRRHAGQAK